MLSVTDYGLGLKTSRTNLLKAGHSAELEAMRVRLGTSKDLQPMAIQTRQKVEQVKAYCPTTQPRSQAETQRNADWDRASLGRVKQRILQVFQLTELKQTMEWERY